jgi:hypothetical protein
MAFVVDRQGDLGESADDGRRRHFQEPATKLDRTMASLRLVGGGAAPRCSTSRSRFSLLLLVPKARFYLQVAPLTAKEVGIPFVTLFQDPLKPIAV